MSAPRGEAPAPEAAALGDEPFEGSRLLVAPALVLLAGFAVLAALYLRGVEQTLASELVRSDLEGKVDLYSREARRLLEGSRLADYLDENPEGLLHFERLLRESDQPGAPATYLHVQSEDRETLLFKGPGLLQQIVVTPDRVELLEGSGGTTRRLVVDEEAGAPRWVDVQQPIEEVLDQAVRDPGFQSAEERFSARIRRSREAMRERLFGFAGAALVLVTLVFGAIRYQFSRIRHLERQMRRQRQLPR